MAYMNMILIGTLNNNINIDILSRNRFQFNYFVLFLLQHLIHPILEYTIFRLFRSVRNEDDDTATKLLFTAQIGRREDVSTVASNFEAIFTPVGGKIVLISSCVQNSCCLSNVSLEPSIRMHILPR